MSKTASLPPTRVEGLGTALQQWVEAGLIRPEQRDAIVRFERAEQRPIEPAAGPPSVVPVVVEVLGYVGIVVVAAAGGLAISQFWPDLDTWAQLLLVGVVTGLVGLGAAFISSSTDAAITRLANFLWLVVTGGVATWIVIFGVAVLDLEEAAPAFVAGLGTAVVAAVLLWWRRATLQVLALFGALVAVTISAISFNHHADPWVYGLAIWGLGVGWGLLSWGELLPHPRAGYALGSVAALGGSIAVAGDTQVPGIWLGLLTSGLLLTAAVRVRSGVLLGLGIPGLLVFVGWTIAYYVGATGGTGEGNLAVTLVILVLGLMLLAGVLVAARSRKGPPAEAARDGAGDVPD